jgi:hypothetical protein
VRFQAIAAIKVNFRDVKQFTFEVRGSRYHDANPLRDASMPSLDKPDHDDHGIDWRRIALILSIQLAVLLALSGAAIIYLNWSSDVAQAEFMSTVKPSASGPKHSPQSSLPVQPIEGRTACTRRA